MSLSALPARKAFAGFASPELIAAIVLALGAMTLHAFTGWGKLFDAGGDNDSLLRLVQVRDLLAGQGWFDTWQYRMGPEGGFAMHWSRLIDAPLALVIAGLGAVGVEQASAEMAAQILWPVFLMAVALYGLMRSAALWGGPAAVLPAAVLGVLALHYTAIFAPGSLDHHNAQVAAALCVLWRLLDRPGMRGGVWAGVLAALMLGIGPEAIPFVAATGIVVSLRFLIWGREEARFARGFGLALAIACIAIFLATVPVSSWFAAACDAFSIVHLVCGGLAGFGLAAATLSHRAGLTFINRAAALAVLGGVTGVVALAAFPQCIADPLAGLDPRLRTFWLDAVSEAQPVWSIVATEPGTAAAFYVTPLFALGILCWRIARRGADANSLSFALLLACAILVSFWQVRGALFSAPIAAVALSAFVARHRLAARHDPGMGASLRMVLAWLVSVNVLWALAVGLIVPAEAGSQSGEAAGETLSRCYSASDHAALAEMPPATVLAVSNLGSAILAHTHHHALAGPYHRNIEGNLAVLDMFMASADISRRALITHRVDLVAHCPANPESAALAGWAPDGLMARLQAGDPPDWLVPLGAQNGPLRLYRVVE